MKCLEDFIFSLCPDLFSNSTYLIVHKLFITNLTLTQILFMFSLSLALCPLNICIHMKQSAFQRDSPFSGRIKSMVRNTPYYTKPTSRNFTTSNTLSNVYTSSQHFPFSKSCGAGGTKQLRNTPLLKAHWHYHN